MTHMFLTHQTGLHIDVAVHTARPVFNGPILFASSGISLCQLLDFRWVIELLELGDEFGLHLHHDLQVISTHSICQLSEKGKLFRFVMLLAHFSNGHYKMVFTNYKKKIIGKI